MLGGEDGLIEFEEGSAERRELRHADHRPREVEDRRRRHVMVLGRDRPFDSGEPATLGLASDRAEQTGLADPGLSGQQQELSAAGEDVLEASVGQVEQVVTSDEERTADDAMRTVHRSEV